MEKNLAEAELAIVTYADTHLRIVRGVAYAMAAVNGIMVITSILGADLVRAAVCAASALVIVWLLAKTRPASIVAP